MLADMISLNPCFSGGWSQRVQRQSLVQHQTVLILVLVEDGLRETPTRASCSLFAAVLILVLVEDGLRVFEAYFNGAEAAAS